MLIAGIVSPSGCDLPAQSAVCYQTTALPPCHHGWIMINNCIGSKCEQDLVKEVKEKGKKEKRKEVTFSIIEFSKTNVLCLHHFCEFYFNYNFFLNFFNLAMKT